jgi:hypothetical protein
MVAELDALERAVRDGLKYLGSAHVDERMKWLEPSPLHVRFDVVKPLGQRDWLELQDLAGRWRKDATDLLDRIEGQQDRWASLRRDVSQFRRLVQAGWREPRTAPNWADLRDALLEELTQKGFTADQAAQGVESFGRSSTQSLLSVLDQPLQWWSGELEAAANYRFTALAAADLAEAVAQFNLAVENTDTPAVEARLTDVDPTSLLRQLHASLRTSTRDDLLVTARTIGAQAAQLLGPLSRKAARASQGHAAQLDAGTGREALRDADALRATLFARSLARLVAWQARWPEQDSPLLAWRQAAVLPFASAFDRPPRAGVADVAAHPGAYEGRRIALEGTLGPVSISHVRGKAISETSLHIKSGVSVGVGLTHIKIDSGGLVEGSYADLSGTYSALPEFSTPVLVPERRRLTQDSEHSWLDWAELTTQEVMTPVAHHLCGRWSWEPDGAANPLRYGTWAANFYRKRL